MIERGTLPYEKVVEGTLGEIAPLSRNNEMSSPAILIVGSTVGELRHRPVVLFTGIEPESFRHLGRLIHWPAIEVKEIQTPETDSIFGELDRQTFSHIVLTSRVGARIVLKQLWDSGRDLRVLAGTRLIVSGEGTARELTERGLRPDFPHDNSGGEGIVRVLSERGERGKLLLVQGQQARDFLQEGLESMGFDVRKVAFHSVVPHPQLGKALPSHDVVYFTSPSGAKAFHQVYGRQGFRGESWCIGKATLRALKAIGIQGKVVSPYVSTNQNAAVEAY
jgi:uroporphyrinogen III methyltransferase/synthase